MDGSTSARWKSRDWAKEKVYITIPRSSILNFTEKGKLLVWTSQRDASGRQVVDVYDEQLKKVGTDLKFINPGRSNLLFLNGKVYVPDYGFGRPMSAYTGSPLEITAAPLALKVFDASL